MVSPIPLMQFKGDWNLRSQKVKDGMAEGEQRKL